MSRAMEAIEISRGAAAGLASVSRISRRCLLSCDRNSFVSERPAEKTAPPALWKCSERQRKAKTMSWQLLLTDLFHRCGLRGLRGPALGNPGQTADLSQMRAARGEDRREARGRAGGADKSRQLQRERDCRAVSRRGEVIERDVH